MKHAHYEMDAVTKRGGKLLAWPRYRQEDAIEEGFKIDRLR
jgi:hypothetical protein